MDIADNYTKQWALLIWKKVHKNTMRNHCTTRDTTEMKGVHGFRTTEPLYMTGRKVNQDHHLPPVSEGDIPSPPTYQQEMRVYFNTWSQLGMLVDALFVSILYLFCIYLFVSLFVSIYLYLFCQ